MRLALWDQPPAGIFVPGFSEGDVSEPVHIVRQSVAACAQALRLGEVDVALLPTLTVLTHTDIFDVLPGGALSMWHNPFARLVLKNGLGNPVPALAFNQNQTQAALLARILLREHYGINPSFVPYEDRTGQALLETNEEAALIVGTEALALAEDGYVLDLGLEWCELANYPLVWGLFAVRKDEAEPHYASDLHEAMEAVEALRPAWIEAQNFTPQLQSFYQDDLRVRLDDLATASLTEFRQYLFYYNVTPEIPDLPLVALSEEEGE